MIRFSTPEILDLRLFSVCSAPKMILKSASGMWACASIRWFTMPRWSLQSGWVGMSVPVNPSGLFQSDPLMFKQCFHHWHPRGNHWLPRFCPTLLATLLLSSACCDSSSECHLCHEHCAENKVGKDTVGYSGCGSLAFLRWSCRQSPCFEVPCSLSSLCSLSFDVCNTSPWQLGKHRACTDWHWLDIHKLWNHLHSLGICT